MCLQWCHVTEILLDNDLPCEHCPVEVRFAHADKTCATCRHFRAPGANAAPSARAQYGFAPAPCGPQCGLTHMALPRANTCCHWNAALTPGPTLNVTAADVAPGLLRYHGARSVAGLFDQSDTAPEYQAVGEAVQVLLAELAVPLVYGVAAFEWDTALNEG